MVGIKDGLYNIKTLLQHVNAKHLCYEPCFPKICSDDHVAQHSRAPSSLM
jgi:hypothetical protein